MKKELNTLKKPINIVVIGSGKAGSYHLKALSNIKNANVVGIMNSGKKNPIELRKQYKINNWIKNVDGLKKLNNIQAIIIAVSNKQTLNIVKEVAILNIPCLIEKPMGTSPKESRMIIDYFKSSSVHNYVGFNRRFYSSFLEAQKFINKSGEPISIHLDVPEPLSKLLMRGKPIDEIKNRLLLNTTHAIDFINFLFGKPLQIDNYNHNANRNGFKIDFMSFMKFKHNKTASFLSHWSSPGPWLLKIYGEDYQVILDLTKNTGEYYSEEFGNNIFKISNDDIVYKPGVLKQNYHFLNSVLKNKKSHANLCTLQEALINNELSVELNEHHN